MNMNFETAQEHRTLTKTSGEFPHCLSTIYQMFIGEYSGNIMKINMGLHYDVILITGKRSSLLCTLSNGMLSFMRRSNC